MEVDRNPEENQAARTGSFGARFIAAAASVLPLIEVLRFQTAVSTRVGGPEDLGQVGSSDEFRVGKLTSLNRVVVVGGGVAGIEIATQLGKRSLRDPKVSVTLVDPDSAHVWKPMLHTIAAGTRDVYQQQISYLAQAYDAGFAFQPGAVQGLDREKRTIELASTALPDGRVLFPARSIGFEVLIFAVGSRANDFGTPGVSQYCHTIDSRIQANRFNEDLRVAMIRSGTEGTVSIAIVGGGATGVELAAELVQLARAADVYAKVDLSARVTITLVESGPRLLAAFPKRIAEAAQARLAQLGVQVRTGLRVASAEEGGLRTQEGELIAAQLMVWSAGVKAPDFLAALADLETTRSNELIVNSRLQTTRDPSIFAVGDCASLTLPGKDRRLPPTAQVAHQQAKYIVDHLGAWIEDRPTPEFKYTDFGSLVSLAEYDGYGSLGKFGIFNGGFIQGRLAQLSHALLYRAHQSRILGFWRGGLIWAVDQINARVRPRIRLG